MKSSYVLKTKIGDEDVFFRGWILENRSRPEFGAKIKDAKHWKQKAICQRFINRNKSILAKFGITEPYRIIPDRYCLYCSKEIPREDRSSKKFCDDKCRKAYFDAN